MKATRPKHVDGRIFDRIDDVERVLLKVLAQEFAWAMVENEKGDHKGAGLPEGREAATAP